MSNAEKQLSARIALAMLNLDDHELTALRELAPGLGRLSTMFAEWLESICNVESQRREGENVVFPPALFADNTNTTVAGALAAAVCLLESIPTERMNDVAFNLLYFTASVAHVRLMERDIVAAN